MACPLENERTWITFGWSTIGASSAKSASASSTISQSSPPSKSMTAPVGSAGVVKTVVRPRAMASTGTGRAPASSTNAGSCCQPGQTSATSSVAVARSAARISSPAPCPTTTRAGIDVVRRGDRVAQRRHVRVVVHGPPQRERRRVDDLRMRRPVPRGAREIQRRRAHDVARPLLVAPGAQLRTHLVRRELVELAVVAEQTPHQRGASEGAGPSSTRNQNPNATSAITAVAPKMRGQHALALVVARGAAQQAPQAVQAVRQRQGDHQRGEDAEERDHDAEEVRVREVVDLGGDPQPGQRLRPPHRQAQQRLHRQHEQREQPVERAGARQTRAPACRGSAPARCPGGAR